VHGVKAEAALRDASILRRQEAPEQLAAVAEAEAASLRDLSDFQMELRIRRADGEWRWIHLRSRPHRNAVGQVIWDGVATDITERKRTEAALHQSREQLRALLARFQHLREEERTRLAREVHDVLGQLLTALKMDMSWWERRFTKIADETLRRALEEKVGATSRLADMMIEMVQKISRELRPSVLDNIGLGAALQFEARQFQERTGIACEVSMPAETFVLDPDRATGIFRIFQELLTNVARHAQATRVVVSLSQTEENVTLEVKDNGRGISEEEMRDPKSLGILGMAERASLMGGRLEIHGSPGQGTTGVLTIPAKGG
jgi:signal transduction histidine kinase